MPRIRIVNGSYPELSCCRMSEHTRLQCRFVLCDVKNWEISDVNGYDIFEPTVSLELEGKNAFEPFGISGVEHPVIMHSLESFLRETLGLIQKVSSQPIGEHRYWLLGTGFGFRLVRMGNNLDIHVEVDGHWGPVQTVTNWPQSKEVGRVTVREWVQGIVTLASELLALFRRLSPGGYSSLKDLESETQTLRDWLDSYD